MHTNRCLLETIAVIPEVVFGLGVLHAQLLRLVLKHYLIPYDHLVEFLGIKGKIKILGFNECDGKRVEFTFCLVSYSAVR